MRVQRNTAICISGSFQSDPRCSGSVPWCHMSGQCVQCTVCMPWLQNQDRREAATQHERVLPQVLRILYLFDFELIWLLSIHKCLLFYKLSWPRPYSVSDWMWSSVPQFQKLWSNWLEILGLSMQTATLPLNDIPEIEEIKSFWTDSDVLYLNVFDFDGIVGS